MAKPQDRRLPADEEGMSRREHAGHSPRSASSGGVVVLPADPPAAARAERRGSRNAAILSLAVAGVAGLLHVWSPGLLGSFDRPVVLPWLVLTAAFACVHLSEVRFQAGRHTHALHLGEVPLIAGFFLIDPMSLILA